MAAKVGDEAIYQGVPCTVIVVKTTLGQQFDTILLEQPVVRVVPDSQVQTVATPPPASPAVPGSPAVPARPGPAVPGRP